MKTEQIFTNRRPLLWLVWGLFVMIVLNLEGGTAVARAHAELESAIPEPGAIVNNPIEQIQLIFTEPILADSQITLFKDDFQQISPVSNQFNPNKPTLLTTIVPELMPGNYTVQYMAFSLDGHEINGSYTFRVSPSNQSLTSQQVAIFGFVILLIIGIVVTWRRTQKQDSDIH